MRSFFTPERMWEPGRKFVHVYLVPDFEVDQKLQYLITQARSVIADYDCLASIPDPWLHVTVAAAADPSCDRQQAADAVRQAVAGTGAFCLRMGSVLTGRSSVLLDSDDIDGGFGRLRTLVVDAFTAVAGGVFSATEAQHQTLAYGTADGYSGDIASQMRRICQPPHALLHVRQALVVDAELDRTAWLYRWQVIDTIDLQ